MKTKLLSLIFVFGLLAPETFAQEPPDKPTTETLIPSSAAEAAPAPEAAAAPAGEEVAPDAAEEAPEESGVQSAFSKLLTHAIELLATILMLLSAWLVKKGITFIEKKTKIDIPAKMEETVAAWAGKSVNYAAEKAHQWNADNKAKMAGPDKLEHALNFGMALAEEHGMSAMAKDKLTKYIESKLGENRTV